MEEAFSDREGPFSQLKFLLLKEKKLWIQPIMLQSINDCLWSVFLL